MAKSKTGKTGKRVANKDNRTIPITKPVVNKEDIQLVKLLTNTTLLRREVLDSLLNPNTMTDVDTACKYPSAIGTDLYKRMYDREGVGSRVVEVMPDESWALAPTVYETESAKNETEFEKAFSALEEGENLFSILHRIDILSGIGRYGILLLGIDDGLELEKPIEGINLETGEMIGTTGKPKRKLTYLRPFDESAVKVDLKEVDVTNARYGLPKLYSVEFESSTGSTTSKTIKIHWTRVLHIADNRKSSEIYGEPRMKRVFNRLLDIKKILGGSAEMFWQGGFPGLSFEVNPEVGGNVDLDVEEIKEQMQLYQTGLQRYLATRGLTVKSLSPQVADPVNHILSQIRAIAISLNIPYRVFLGSEQAQLASSQDIKTWNKRVARRQNIYLTPMVIRPFVERLIGISVLPKPKEYHVDWPDLDSPTDKDKADVALVRTQAFEKYVNGGVDALIPPREYFVTILGLSADEADELVKAAELYVGAEEVKEEKIEAEVKKRIKKKKKKKKGDDDEEDWEEDEED